MILHHYSERAKDVVPSVVACPFYDALMGEVGEIMDHLKLSDAYKLNIYLKF